MEKQKCKNEFYINENNGEEWIYNSAISTTYSFDNIESLHKYLDERYKSDKVKYLLTGKWPNTRFCYRDSSWIYYYYLQLTDPEVKLNKYFDFDYYSSDWTRESIIELTEKYGEWILFPFCVYSDTNPNKPFDEWYEEYKKMHTLTPVIIPDEVIEENVGKLK